MLLIRNGHISRWLGNSSSWPFCVFAFLLPFPISTSRIGIWLLLFFTLKKIFTHYKESELREICFRNYLPHLFFLATALSLFYSSDLSYGFKQIEKFLPLILLPTAIIAGKLNSSDINSVLRSFLFGCIIISFYLIGQAFYNSFYLEGEGLVFDPRVLRDPRITYIHSVNWGGNYFFSEAFIKHMHPSYFGMYLLFCFAIIWQTKEGFSSLGFKISISIFFIVILFLLSARATHIALIAVALAIFCRLFSITSKRLLFAFSILSVLILLFVLFNPRWIEYNEVIGMVKEGRELRGSLPERLMVWDSSIDLIRESPLVGYGVGDAQSMLNGVYRKLNYSRLMEARYNAHNQFLQTQLILGIIGTALLLGFFYNIWRAYKKTGKIETLAFFIVLLIHFSFESMLERYAGIVFFVYFYSLLVYPLNQKLTGNDNNN